MKSLFKASEKGKGKPSVKSTQLWRLVLVPKLSVVYMVSVRKDLGVRNLFPFIKETTGPRGNVWVIGTQNVGKSTLINAFAKREGAKLTRLTESAVLETKLRILRITGILPVKAKMYDTPGLLHSYLNIPKYSSSLPIRTSLYLLQYPPPPPPTSSRSTCPTSSNIRRDLPPPISAAAAANILPADVSYLLQYPS